LPGNGNETETKRKPYFLTRNSKTVVPNIFYERLYSLFRSRVINPENTFIWVFAEPLNSILQTHFSNYVKIKTGKLQFLYKQIEKIYVKLFKIGKFQYFF
jgi:hypothetical protein